jgi:hypothetical protein
VFTLETRKYLNNSLCMYNGEWVNRSPSIVRRIYATKSWTIEGVQIGVDLRDTTDGVGVVVVRLKARW